MRKKDEIVDEAFKALAGPSEYEKEKVPIGNSKTFDTIENIKNQIRSATVYLSKYEIHGKLKYIIHAEFNCEKKCYYFVILKKHLFNYKYFCINRYKDGRIETSTEIQEFDNIKNVSVWIDAYEEQNGLMKVISC